jgi:hypothetical protein
MSKIQQALDALESQKSKLLDALDQERSRKQFECKACGKMHAINKCDVIQTHWYTSPHGCTGGDYWSQGELHIICPVTGIGNRLLTRSEYWVPWNKRSHYAHNAADQFSRMYKHLFKSVKDTYRDSDFGDGYQYINTYYIDEHHKKFGIDVGYDKDGNPTRK